MCYVKEREREDYEIGWICQMVKLLSHYRKVKVKYLGVLEVDRFLGDEIKLKVSKAYFKDQEKF